MDFVKTNFIIVLLKQALVVPHATFKHVHHMLHVLATLDAVISVLGKISNDEKINKNEV
jgi:hypothetical protein